MIPNITERSSKHAHQRNENIRKRNEEQTTDDEHRGISYGPLGHAKACQDLVFNYVYQLVHGCGSADCKQVVCDTGRRNTSHGQPVRRYTPRSARTIAITLAAGPKPWSRLCRLHPDISKNMEVDGRAERPRDPSSLVQALSDSVSVRQVKPHHDIYATDDTANGNACEDLRLWLVRLEELRSDYFNKQGNFDQDAPSRKQQIAKLFAGCLVSLTRSLSLPNYPQWKHVNDTISAGITYPRRKGLQVKVEDMDFAQTIQLLDQVDNQPHFRMYCRWLGVMAEIDKIEDIAAEVNAQTHEEYAVSNYFDVSPARFLIPIWQKKAFLRYWEGEMEVQIGTIPAMCLRLLHSGCLVAQMYSERHEDMMKRYNMPVVADRTDPLDVARTWLERGQREQSVSIHLLDFDWLFTTAQRILYFRTLNHLRMQRAHSHAKQAEGLRIRATPDGLEFHDTIPRLDYVERFYLLLTVSRTDVLPDALDQLWQRRAGELLRPLRVRLGEADFDEPGHDLGGVQIEFFNLMCRKLSSEEMGMFTTDAETGLSYFRPGSLQPLHMFELCGLLLGLAIYNGITLPVDFPLAFYFALLDLPCTELEDIQDGWPHTYKTLKWISEQEEDLQDMDYVFPLEANGIRLSISSIEEFDKSPQRIIVAQVCEATPILHHPANSTSSPPSISIDLNALNWPGWHLAPSGPSSPVEITTTNKTAYMKDHIAFLTSTAIAPQLHAFTTGLHRILPPPHLRLLSSPANLQTLVEGTPHISIPALRAAAQYDSGYRPDSAYIAMFWSVVESWPEWKQRAMLKFVTAAERLPVGEEGMKHVSFRISRSDQGEGEESLPTSSTCFGTLYLPRYRTREVLEAKLGQAVEMGGEGFGLA